jgi:hypothetical protein
MNKKRIKNAVILMSLFLTFSICFLSCQNPFSWYLNQGGETEDLQEDADGDDPLEEPEEDPDLSKISLQRDSFTLAWDPPEGETVTGYKVYFRVHGETEWTELDQIAGDTPSYTVSYPELDYGEYDFAVTSIHSGEESAYHTSLDTTAMPESGWYLDWQAES